MAHRRASCTLTLLPRNPSLSLAVGMSNLQRESGLRGRPRGRSRRRSECQKHSASQVPGVSIESEGRSSPGASPVRAPNPGICWSNHQYLLQVGGRVTGAVLWANLHPLFWRSLFPFVTGWMGQNHFAPLPTVVMGRCCSSRRWHTGSSRGSSSLHRGRGWSLTGGWRAHCRGPGLVGQGAGQALRSRAEDRPSAGRRPLDNSPDRGNIPVQPLGCPGTPNCPARAVGRIGQAALNTGD